MDVETAPYENVFYSTATTMSKNKIITGILTTIVSLLFGTESYGQTKNQALHQLFERYSIEVLKLDPLGATFQGNHSYDAELANEGASTYTAEKARFNKKYLSLLGNFDPVKLNTADRISFKVLQSILKTDLEKDQYHTEYLPIQQFSSIPLLIGQLGSGNSAQPFKTPADYHKWIARTIAFRTYADTAIANMKKGMAKGIVLSKALVLKVIPQMEELAETDSAKSIFYNPIRNMPKTFSLKERAVLTKKCHHAFQKNLIPAYQRLAVFLKKYYLPVAAKGDGLSAIPTGRAMYDYYVRYYTTTNHSPEEIYQMGLNEVARITTEMEKIKQQIGFSGSLADFFIYLRTDRKFMPFKSPDEVLKAYTDVYEKIKPHLPELFDIQPKAKFEIRRVESFREASQNGPSYMVGSADGKRPGIFYVPVPDATKINVTFLGMEATFIHEAIPGHHYQIALQQENRSLPSFRKNISFSAYTEGWGLYVESLGKQLGCYTDPYQQMGALNNEIHRAIRLVCDVGLHTGKMTREQAVAYMLKHESISEADAVLSAERYMAIPGQALCYTVGELEILRLRDKYSQSLGKNFSLIRFHRALLKQGDMPLDVLDEYMADWAKN